MAQHRTKLGPCDAIRHNPWNGVQCLGHANGVVTMWTPNITVPVVRLLCHKARPGARRRGGGGVSWQDFLCSAWHDYQLGHPPCAVAHRKGWHQRWRGKLFTKRRLLSLLHGRLKPLHVMRPPSYRKDCAVLTVVTRAPLGLPDPAARHQSSLLPRAALTACMCGRGPCARWLWMPRGRTWSQRAQTGRSGPALSPPVALRLMRSP